MLKKLGLAIAFDLARSPLGRVLTGWVFAHLSCVLPVKRVRETPDLLAFYHPRPAYPVHILIVPRRAIAGFGSLEESDGELLREVLQMTGDLIGDLDLGGRGARLVVNGGRYQEVPQLHFHLVCDPVREATSRS